MTTWAETWMEVARTVGKRSHCARAQYGAVIISGDNRVLSVGYNGPPAGGHQKGPCTDWCPRAMAAAAGDDVDPSYLDCHAIHAEMNALLRANNLWTEKDPELYVNGVTCLRCAVTIANSGVKKVTMFVDAYEQKRNPAATASLLQTYGVKPILI